MDQNMITSCIFILRNFNKTGETDILIEPYTDCLYGQPVPGDAEALTGLEFRQRIDGLDRQEVLQVDFGGGGNG